MLAVRSLVPEWAKPLRPLEGIARKVRVHAGKFSSDFYHSPLCLYPIQLVLLFIALSAVGWIVFVAGFGEVVKQ